MCREDVPWYPAYYYIIYYLIMLITPFILGYITSIYIDNFMEYLIGIMLGSVVVILSGWIIGAIFYNLCKLPSNYTRKILHIFGFLFTLLLPGSLEAIQDDNTVNISAAFSNIIIDVLWAAYSYQIFILIMSKPSRACSNYLCGNTHSDNPLRWINCCENTIDAFERREDRPNHLLWMNTQFTAEYFVIFCLSFWWNILNTQIQIIIPAVISGLGDGLAEPIGVLFGKNGCYTGIDCTYKVFGCCTRNQYTRSIPGSFMVLLSGYLGCVLAKTGYTDYQFLFAMILIPPIGCIVEAKSPHTLDQPLISLVVGIVAIAISYIPL